MFNIGDKVKIINPNVEEQGELLAPETINLLKALDFTGVVTQSLLTSLCRICSRNTRMGYASFSRR